MTKEAEWSYRTSDETVNTIERLENRVDMLEEEVITLKKEKKELNIRVYALERELENVIEYLNSKQQNNQTL